MPLSEQTKAKEIGRKIKLLRIRHGMTLQQISTSTGLSTLTLSQIENGNYPMFLDSPSQFLESATLYARYFDQDISRYMESPTDQSQTIDINYEGSPIPYFLRNHTDGDKK